jgi:hypothetical protein
LYRIGPRHPDRERLPLEQDYPLQVIPGWWRDDAASRPSRLPDKIGTCEASAVAPDDRQRQQRAMPSGKIVPRSSWSAGTASRRPRSRRVWTRLYTQGRSPKEAAEQAAVSAYNAQTAADRLRKR